ncbi:DUF1836 domain-containing protein [Clostridium sp. CX1]|uniref:DUF1836 domain-containing protein n=1 Tax=Clostridium tanneri TaxID=3037988 RepID=A0ABU4JWF3_9CLOT|nr:MULTISPECIES: DUF1836 domain-containing protein [unclassified Clostridium]MCT8975709.1 DUF1836 domain-containing protein [Clostridium sp. CX1]MDW8802426.1 DUF1836 domain-containing protein [Clostridium sp. A1-XYC3]
MSKNTIVPYDDLPRYDLFLSQVIDYLNDKFEGDKYTNNIVQNYIKNEVISKPEDGKKRGYTKVHLAQLVLLSYMRPILTTEEIKSVFHLAFNEINNGDDDIISWEKAYKIFSDIQEDSFEDILAREHFNEERLQNIIKEMDLESKDQERILVFFAVMSLICQASAIKRLVQHIVNSYDKESMS